LPTTFADLGVPRDLVDALAARAVVTPFPIQQLTVADALAGRDLCGRAPTGSGKTLAFGIPLILRAGKGRPGRPRALVLVPTRELAAQISDELAPLAAARKRSIATFYGGTNINRDQRRLKQSVDIAIACPGRLADLVRRGFAALDDVDLVIVDEADRMADMGFLPEVKRLLDRTSSERQTLLFSATLDGDVDALVRRYQRDPVRHEFEAPAETRGDVQHLFWHAEHSDRVRLAGQVAQRLGSTIVFTRTKHAADRVARQLGKEGVTAVAIHGNRSQGQRERALADFTAGRATTLVATDVAARGIHVDNVGAVVHFDAPATDKDYVHRSGRTGRAGATGVVITFVTKDTLRDVKALQRVLSLPQRVEAPTLEPLGTVTAAPRHRASREAPQARRSGAPRPHQGEGAQRRRRPGAKPAMRRAQ
jgi:superfamily II DNA/RNA helicase